jgi:hypothetical protein
VVRVSSNVESYNLRGCYQTIVRDWGLRIEFLASHWLLQFGCMCASKFLSRQALGQR